MGRFGSMLALVVVLAGLGISARAEDKKDKDAAGVLKLKMKSLAGQDVNLADYQGKVVLLVNVASRCGLTPQYKELEALYEKYGKEGLVVVGIPCNDFLGQEPGTSEEIAKFCESKYGVKFDMLSKVVVKGEGICPLYKHLTSKETDPKFGGAIKWNFTKFLIGKNGEIVSRFESAVKPESKEMTEAIEAELKK